MLVGPKTSCTISIPITFFVLFAALFVGAGCANSHSVQTFPSGLSVHTFSRDYANSHVVAVGTNFFMVDSGLEVNAPALALDLKREGFDPAKLRAIVVTHGHADHAGGASFFQKSFGTKVVGGKDDTSMFQTGKNDKLCPTDFQARQRVEADQKASYTPFNPDILVDANLTLSDLTGIPAVAVALPGHTAGSVVVTLPEAAFVGDLFRGAIVGSTAEVHFYMCDLSDNQKDVRALLDQLAPSANSFFTGHFGPVSRDYVAITFPGAAR